jgi:hypothetical protein
MAKTVSDLHVPDKSKNMLIIAVKIAGRHLSHDISQYYHTYEILSFIPLFVYQHHAARPAVVQ